MARIVVWLTPEDGVQEAPFPLLCRYVLDIVWSILTSNSAAFEEVSTPRLQDSCFILTMTGQRLVRASAVALSHASSPQPSDG